jgi:hypothetical protein
MQPRRSVLLTTIALGTGGLAGCSRTGPRTPDDGPAVTETPGETGDGTVADATIESGEGSCGSEARAEITQTAEGITATGQLVTPTPCYLATLEDASVEDGTATFRIDAERDPDVDACVECVGTVPFELTARLGAGVGTVVLELGGNDPETVEKQLD